MMEGHCGPKPEDMLEYSAYQNCIIQDILKREESNKKIEIKSNVSCKKLRKFKNVYRCKPLRRTCRCMHFVVEHKTLFVSD